MSLLKLDKILKLLEDFTRQTNTKLEVIVIGGLALDYYGKKDRATHDLDAEVKGKIDELFNFLKSKGIPTNIGENISGWSVISLPPDYRDRTLIIKKDGLLTVKVLNPVDFIISKLRRLTEEDLDDILFVARKFKVKPEDIQNSAEEAIKNSPRDTAIMIFKKNVAYFLKRLQGS